MAASTGSSIAALLAAIYTAVHTVPADESHTASIRLTNRDQGSAITVRLAICPAGYVAPAAPASADFIEALDVVIEPGGIIEETAVLLAPGEKVVAFSSAATATCRVDYFKNALADVVVSKLAIAAGVYTAVHTVGAGQNHVANIRTVNRDAATSIAIRLAICPPGYAGGGAAPAAADHIEAPDLVIEGGGLVENTGKALKAGEVVVVYSNLATLTVRVAAIQE